MAGRAIAVVAGGALAIAIAAAVPSLAVSPPVPPPDRGPVPFELSGLLVTECSKASGLASVDACLSAHPVVGLTPSPQFDGVERSLYHQYLLGWLLPCLEAHGYTAEPLGYTELRHVDVSAWYLTVVLQHPDFERAYETWYDCPVVPDFLKGSTYPPHVVVE